MFRFLRQPWVPTAAIGGVLVAVIATGTAVAATGTTLNGGQSNSEKKTTSIKNTGSGPALSLSTSKSSTPPLGVSNSTQIPHLNASLLGGLTAGQLQRKVTGKCSATTSITAVGATGTVTCSPKREVLFDSAAANGTAASTYVVPPGVTQVIVEVRSGGGGGGGSTTDSTGYGSGGGQGGYERGLITVTPGETLYVAVGQGGAPGSEGGDSEIGDTTTTYLDEIGGFPGADANGGGCLTHQGESGGVAEVGDGPELTAVTVLEVYRGEQGGAADSGGTSCGSGSGSPGADTFAAGGGGQGEGYKGPKIADVPGVAEAGVDGYVLIQPVG